MAFSFLQSHTEADAAFVFPSPVTAGSLFVFGFRWEGASGSGNVSGSQSGGGAVTILTRVDTSSGDHHAQMGYLLTNNGDEAFPFSVPTHSFLEIVGAEFAYTDTPTIDTSNTGSGSGTSLASGAITLDSTASDWLAVGWGSSYSSGQTYSARNINGVAANGSALGIAAYSTLFWRFLSTTGFSGGTATCTDTVSDDWICNVLAIKSGTAAAPAAGPLLHVIRSGIRLR